MSASAGRALLAPHALLPSGWTRDVRLRWDERGTLVEVTPEAGNAHAIDPGASQLPRARGVVVPGMPNLHSHAWQRGFAGLAERRTSTDDSFWGWRESMYRVAGAVTPPQLEDLATQAYVEMLRAGYTSVCEFHYLHHDPAGHPYADPAEMSWRLVAAAERAGIGLTLLPVLYQASGFGGTPPLPAQRRFVHDVAGVTALIERLVACDVRAGLAPHSLRAVPPGPLREAVCAMHAFDAGAPIHIHVAEQQREVDEALAWSGQRPVQWLLDHAPVDERWCLVHATHADEAELMGIIRRGATVGLCPSTEANLGDGLFPAARYLAAGGGWGIGSDSHACIDPAEELRGLEYGQRLVLRQRNVLASERHPQVADRLWLDAVEGGARASARPVAGLAVGQRADFLVLADDGLMQGLAPAEVLASHVFAPHDRRALREVWVGGQRRVCDGAHPLDEDAVRRFVAARHALLHAV